MRLMWLYNADRRCIEKHMPALKRYVDYVGQVRSCPSCRAPTNKQTQTSGGLPIFYMNGDWMEARPQSEELLLSGPPLAALHYIIDLEIVAELSAVLGGAAAMADAAAFSARAKAMRAEFNRAFFIAPRRKLCGEQEEPKKGGTHIDLSCGGPGGGTIDKVLFASYGTPSGSCTNDGQGSNTFTAGSCAANATAIIAIVSRECLGKTSCALDAATAGMGGDPCVGTIKTLAVAVNCSASPPPATPGSYGAGQVRNAVPLHYGFPPTAAANASVLAALIADVNVTHANHLTTGFVGNKYILPVLTAAGNASMALDVMLQTTYPSWGYQVRQGATTLWENWSGKPDDSTSEQMLAARSCYRCSAPRHHAACCSPSPPPPSSPLRSEWQRSTFAQPSLHGRLRPVAARLSARAAARKRGGVRGDGRAARARGAAAADARIRALRASTRRGGAVLGTRRAMRWGSHGAGDIFFECQRAREQCRPRHRAAGRVWQGHDYGERRAGMANSGRGRGRASRVPVGRARRCPARSPARWHRCNHLRRRFRILCIPRAIKRKRKRERALFY